MSKKVYKKYHKKYTKKQDGAVSRLIIFIFVLVFSIPDELDVLSIVLNYSGLSNFLVASIRIIIIALTIILFFNEIRNIWNQVQKGNFFNNQ